MLSCTYIPSDVHGNTKICNNHYRLTTNVIYYFYKGSSLVQLIYCLTILRTFQLFPSPQTQYYFLHPVLSFTYDLAGKGTYISQFVGLATGEDLPECNFLVKYVRIQQTGICLSYGTKLCSLCGINRFFIQTH